MAKRSIADVDVAGRRVLTRVDFNVPLDGDRITDDRRIGAALPTIRSILSRGGRAVLASHLGRPKGAGFEAAFSLRPVATRLEELLGGEAVGGVVFPSEDCLDDRARAAVEALPDGGVVLLENLRFHAGEKKGEADFAARLAPLGEIYCNDAFGTCHRTDASMVALPRAMKPAPAVAGFLLEAELRYLQDAIADPRHPFVAILGGAKVSDKLGAIRHLLERVDALVVGGAMAYTLLAARGVEVGSSRVEPERLDEAKAVLELASAKGRQLLLPIDHVCGRALEAGTETTTVDGAVPEGWMGLDIGPKTAEAYASAIRAAGTVVWNGPMGVFEMPPFDVGTRRVAEAVAHATEAGAVTIAGGGDTAAAVEAFGVADRLSHVSTGGGASLEMLEGKAFASLEALDDA
ncbi:MAG: phosphoglycerate kinase [Planctomycetota bacterium]|jgi:phosphoglycerate kinase